MSKKKRSKKTATKSTPEMGRRSLMIGGIGTGVAALAGGVWAFMPGPSKAAEITVYKSQYCGCCGKWAKHMRRNGYSIVVRNTEDMDRVKALFGVPDDLQSCHTATIDGYVVEGHVPAKEVNKLLAERPKATGISVPGMPTGSPGMEAEDPESYKVVLFDKDGTRQIYGKY